MVTGPVPTLSGMDVVVVADTHLRGGAEALPAAVLDDLRRADLILHAGDITSLRALTDLRGYGTVAAVLGNNDGALAGVLPDELVLQIGGVEVAMVHDSGPSAGRPGRLARRYPGAALVVFGHSHIPVDEEGLGGQRLFNPGSPTQRRMQPRPTYGRLHIEHGRLTAHEIVALPLRAPGRRAEQGSPSLR
jgi:putative phosphoesterase